MADLARKNKAGTDTSQQKGPRHRPGATRRSGHPYTPCLREASSPSRPIACSVWPGCGRAQPDTLWGMPRRHRPFSGAFAISQRNSSEKPFPHGKETPRGQAGD